MIKNISLALLYSFVLSCTGQESKLQLRNIKDVISLKDAPYNITDEGDGTKSNYDNLSPEFINKAKKLLEQKKFQFPDENTGLSKKISFFGQDRI